ncbi:5-bromo-4-chloroindolyl phosphate hydrolysis family protein [Enterococcus columbae]|uniref:5-bromo-4-chloroindolyl phosphate hydrolysis protein n=1 Tax=Enterococcus columbae DSM 7374 = ATCC 51263 TaxID=1121865 RepID=S1NE41_9ENTE|nr:5-bromo-4-chloroindolyl phosphate hydrolysis family protein [Enterococcus columbae]EOT39913.1 hypothetical protein OMW_01702 [Enterococcus columbae DSM 7374 = ATCC 51263]EOW83898.1 hypothetical protein I568_01345 [Enterococcus columbae DSM 7374 = ATCC 51263]
MKKNIYLPIGLLVFGMLIFGLTVLESIQYTIFFIFCCLFFIGAAMAVKHFLNDALLPKSFVYALATSVFFSLLFNSEFLEELTDDFHEVLLDLFLASLLLTAVFAVYFSWNQWRSQPKKTNYPKLSKVKQQNYYALGMTDSEIELFRDTMYQAKMQIEQLQANILSNSKLKALDLRRDCLKISKALFKEIVKNPKRLADASHFLYTHLPNLVDLTNKYIEINQHEIKNKEAYDKLEEGIQVIDQLAVLIGKDYQDFVADDLEDLDLEINVARKHIDRNADDQNLQF